MHYLKKIIQKNHQDRKSRSKSVLFFNIFFIVTISIGLLVYFVQVTKMVNKGYVLQKNEKQINILREELKRLEVVMVNSKSIQTVTSRVESLGFIPSQKGEYLHVISNEIAQR